MNDLNELKQQVIFTLSQKMENKTAENIRSLIRFLAANPVNPINLNEEQIETTAKEIEYNFGLTQEQGSLIVSEDNFEFWLPGRKAEINPYYWERYKTYLFKLGFPYEVIATLDNVTDQITGLLEDPEKDGRWYRRGMVVGHVQSGKTANFIGVINKAADAGYKLIIILAGIQENLRSQTQTRIDDGFIGRNSNNVRTLVNANSFVGVGLIDSKHVPMTFTSRSSDFRDGHIFRPEKYLDPTVLVVKKNTHILEHLKKWLQKTNANQAGTISNLPLLMLDDEADNASLNTNKDSDDSPTAINKRIRDLLNLFNRKCYLAYTATPFANIFINPETDDEMYKDDLFPKDFIKSLDPPSNYIGPKKLFSDYDGKPNIIRRITDAEDILPLKHKKDYNLTCLPESLKEAVYSHILTKAIKITKGMGQNHHSMLIHISRFVNVQKKTKTLLLEFLQKVENGIRYNYKATFTDAVSNKYIRAIHALWQREFKVSYPNWKTIQDSLLDAVASIQVVDINGASSDVLNYEGYKKNGMNVIAVGGMRLSRGLTLENLTTSYFYRNTSMYDTLMQMGRWFGYRDGYEDLCRIFLTPITEDYFAHINTAIEELRSEIRYMELAGKTPKEFGLKVRTHPDSLLITARNKMRSAETLKIRIDLLGKLIETYVVNDPRKNTNNFNLLGRIVGKLESITAHSINSEKNIFWEGIPSNLIFEFLEQYENHPNSLSTDPKPIIEFLRQIDSIYKKWDVVLINIETNTKHQNKSRKISNDITIGVQYRTCVENDGGIEIGSNRRVGNISAEQAGIPKDKLEELKTKLADKGITGLELRKIRPRPLLMLHVIHGYRNIEDANSLIAKDIFAYGISFPCNDSIIVDPVEYKVNPVYVKNAVNEYIDEEAEENYD